MRILLAEDSLELALPIKLVLEADGHRVTHVVDGAAAVVQYEMQKPDLVLLDMIMPTMDGIEACRRIKAIPVKQWIPVIMLSAFDSREDLINGLEAGADEYLNKPVDLQVLVARMRSKQRTIDFQSRLSGILDNVHEGIITIDRQGLMQSFNQAAERIFGYVSDEVIGKNVNMLMPEPYKARHDGYLHNYLSTNQAKVIGTGRKAQGCRKNGEVFPINLAITRIDSTLGVQFIGLVRDISQEEKDREHIEHLALHDALTGLPNRASFINQLSACVKAGNHFAILFVDIDGFKPVNDNFGHGIGDQVLVTIAQRMQGAVANGDFVARVGGDEFVVLLQNLNAPQLAEQVGMRILEKVTEPMNFNGKACRVGASIGAAIYPLHGLSGEAVLTAADNAMYQAKRNGKNRVVQADSPTG